MGTHTCHDLRVTDHDLTSSDDIAPGEHVKIRLLLFGGAFVAFLGMFVMATDNLGRGLAYVTIGVIAIVLGVKMAQSVTEGAQRAAFTAWYTACLGLAIMGGGAAVTIPARNAKTDGGQVVLFLAAGVLLWMGVTCVIAAIIKARKASAA